jgi:Protein of unknown function (DUF1559)
LAFAASREPNRASVEAAELFPTRYPATNTTQGNSAGADDEIFGFHPGGVNAIVGDGSVRFLNESLNIVVQRSLITPNGGEAMSTDAY